MKSIRMKITVAIVICSLITTSIISLLSISDTRELSNAAAEKELVLTCENTGEEINALISRIEQSVDTLSDIAMRRLDFPKFKNNSAYESNYTNELLEDFYTFAEHTDGAITAYIRYNPEFAEPTSGIFLTRNDTQSAFDSVTPTDFSMYDPSDAAHVGWYYIPVANKAPLWMDPYLNANINVYMISYVVPLYENSTSVGILGMDIDFGQLTSLVDNAIAFNTGYSFVVSSTGNVLYHNDIASGTDLATYNDGELSCVKDFVLDTTNQGKTLQYSYNGEEKYLAYVELKNGMKLVLTAPLEEITADIVPYVEELTNSAVQIQTVQNSNEVIFKTGSLSVEQRDALNRMLMDNFAVDEKLITSETISSTISSEMQRDAIVSVIIATVCMLIYIWFRFKDIRFAGSAVLALLHDVLVVLAFYAAAKVSVGNTFIACMLTIVGYSINATIVIFDRIRENLVEMPKESLEEVVNRSITQTLSRSLFTSLTTFFMVAALCIFGATNLVEFALPLMAGIICGTFSSICLTGPIWYLLRKYFVKKESED